MTTALTSGILTELDGRFGPGTALPQPTADGMPTFWVPREKLRDVLRYLKTDAPQPYRMLYDLTAIDERERQRRDGQAAIRKSASRRPSPANAPRCPRSPTCGRRPTGTSAKCGTCSASRWTGIPT